MRQDQLIKNILNEKGYPDLEFNDEIKRKIIYPAIDFLNKKREKISELNFENILIISLFLLMKIVQVHIKITPRILILTSTIIWHSTIHRPNDNRYYTQEEIGEKFDRSLTSPRHIREELGITEKKYDNLDDFLNKLDNSISLREKLRIEIEVKEISEQEYNIVKEFVTKKLIGRQRAQSAIECSTFLFFNKDNYYSKNEIYYAIEKNLRLPGLTPRRSFNSDISRYTENAEAKNKRSPQLFTITNIHEKEHKIQLIPEIRAQIDKSVSGSIPESDKEIEVYVIESAKGQTHELIDSPILKNIDGPEFIFKGRGSYALMIYSDDKFILLKNAIVLKDYADYFPTNFSGLLSLREKLITKNFLIPNSEGNFELNVNLEFSSPSPIACICSGASYNGSAAFKLKNNSIISLKDYINEIKGEQKHEPKFWIFQSNPEKYDLENAIKELEEDVFMVNQYKNEIKTGDKVLFWVSGENAGIIGYGDVLTDPVISEQNPESMKFLKSNDLKEKSLRVWVSYNEIKPKILKTDLQTEYPEVIDKISIFRFAQGTNFPLEKEIWNFIINNSTESSVTEMITSFNPELSKDEIINNDKLMEIFKVSNSGGMRRSHKTNSLVLISDHTKGVYEDRWEEEILHYTGMGLTGDQSLDYMQNKTLNESRSNNVNLFLFEVFKPREYTYKGIVKLIGNPYQEEQPNINETLRNVWVFPLQLIEDKFPKIIEKKSHYTFTTRKKLNKDLIDSAQIEQIKDLVLYTKQIILYGPPGTGKTYIAQVIAQEIANNRYEIIQFHPSYSYEDFVEWIEAIPSDDKTNVIFEPKPRIFRLLCEEVSRNPQKYHVLIIDEINRGDLGRIFGELILGLETNNRNLEIKTPLSYSLGNLKIPENLLIIGTMNSVDRSIAIVDYALRRRFSFYLMMPDNIILDKWLNQLDLNLTEDLKNQILILFSNLNKKIRENRKLGRHYPIGHTYFFVNSEDKLKINWEYMIKPLIEEYFNFNEEDLADYEFDKLIQQ